MKKKILSLICARGSSKGIPDKNITLLCGKPLIGWAIEQALSISFIDHVYVSTDSEIIAQVSKEYGAKVVFKRPANLAKDDTPEFLVWKHAINEIENYSKEKFDFMLSIPATSPLRNNLDIENCIYKLTETECDTVIAITDAHRNPYFNMVKLNSDGIASKIISNNDIYRRQDAPLVHDMTTVAFAGKVSFIKNNSSIYDGIIQTVHVPIERSIDIDTPFDLKIAELLKNSLEIENG